MKSNSNIQVVLSPYDLTDDYNRHVGVTLLSLLENCSNPVTVHLLYNKKLSIGKETLMNYNISCYQKIADKYGCEIYYHHIELPDWISKISVIKKGFSPGSLMRLSLDSTLKNIDKVIYLDCDMVILTDISLLWNTSLGDYCIGACSDSAIPFWPKKTSKKLIKKGYNLKNYFNAGLLVLNLKKLREDNFSDKTYKYLMENLDVPYIDQDALNWYCNGKFFHIPEKYNMIASLYPESKGHNKNADVIIHYAGKKPWDVYSGHSDDYYWQYLIKTPWCEDIETYITYIREAPNIKNIIKKDFISKFTNGNIFQRFAFVNKFILSIIKSIVRNALKLLAS